LTVGTCGAGALPDVWANAPDATANPQINTLLRRNIDGSYAADDVYYQNA
jgi:hypothetical protein